jgi:hypothetical protein
MIGAIHRFLLTIEGLLSITIGPAELQKVKDL